MSSRKGTADSSRKKRTVTRKLKVALVDDFLTTDGGAQKVLKIFKDIWPQADVYAITFFPERFGEPIRNWKVTTSFVSKLPFSRNLEQQYKILYPIAAEMFDFTGYDLVISSTYAGYSKAVIVPPNCVHISYVHTVPRFLWGYRTARHDQLGFVYKNLILPPLEHYWRIWDRQISVRPDALITNSANIARRVWKFYRREATVIHPPVDVEPLLALKLNPQDHFLYFGRLEKYKCVDIAIRSCVAAKQKLRIVGSGSYEQELKQLVTDLRADDLVTFVGWLDPYERNKEIVRAKAFVFPGPDEDFGIVLAEALAGGIPVIAFNSGGAAEIIEDGVTGILIDEFSQESLDSAVARFDASKFTAETCRRASMKFSVDEFKRKMTEFVAKFV